jgi:hypothetical protein
VCVRHLHATGTCPQRKRELTGLALLGEMLGQVNTLDRCDHDVGKVCDWVEKHLHKLHADDTDYLASLFLSIAEKARRGADIARKLCTNKRTHLLVPTHTEKQN